MSACEHIRAGLGGYVLGALEPDEADAVREHLERCSECAREHASLAGLPALLTLAEPIESAPPLASAVEERVLDAVARERTQPRPHTRRRWLRRPRVMIPALAALAAVAIALVVALGGGSRAPYDIALQPTAAGGAAGGHTQLKSTAGGTTLHMWVKGLPADPNVVYEVRCDAAGWSASAGTFRVDARGRAVVVLTTAARRGQYDSIRVVRRSSDTDVLTASLN